MAYYGNGAILAGLITLIFTVILALFPAIQCWGVRKSPYSPALNLLGIYPLLWVGCEFIRSSVFTGFPWLLLGYTQTFSWLAGYAKVGSVFLVSWVTLFLSCLVLFCVKRNWKFKLSGLALIMLMVAGGWVLRQHEFTQPSGPQISVALVQGNISESEKWQEGALPTILNTYANLTGSVLNTSLIIWPENAIPALPQDVMSFIDALDTNAKTNA
jgi:apolipoprotein N-acyltransferase